jgi:hypothetical protein
MLSKPQIWTWSNNNLPLGARKRTGENQDKKSNLELFFGDPVIHVIRKFKKERDPCLLTELLLAWTSSPAPAHQPPLVRGTCLKKASGVIIGRAIE